MVTSILPLGVEDICVTKRGKVLLGPLNLSLSGTGLTVVLGPNGSGKTTLLRAMHGLEKIRSGKTAWNCDAVDARRFQSFVFQTPVLLRRSVGENLAYPLSVLNIDAKEISKRTRYWLDKARIGHVADIDARLVSGGEKQKLAIARALIVEPQLLFLDEPTTSLDGQSIREIETMLKEAVVNGVRVVMATHDIGQAKRLADDVWFLYRGKMHEHARPKKFFSSPETREAGAFLKGEIVE
ncbi:MAG: ATP-binding cassette domain-containing protein [Pseudomonadota bacterium]